MATGTWRVWYAGSQPYVGECLMVEWMSDLVGVGTFQCALYAVRGSETVSAFADRIHVLRDQLVAEKLVANEAARLQLLYNLSAQAALELAESQRLARIRAMEATLTAALNAREP